MPLGGLFGLRGREKRKRCFCANGSRSRGREGKGKKEAGTGNLLMDAKKDHNAKLKIPSWFVMLK